METLDGTATTTVTATCPVISIESAISRGFVIEADDEILVPAKYSPSQRELRQSYKRLRVSLDPPEATPDDVEALLSCSLAISTYLAALSMCKGDLGKLWSLFNTAYDTAARGPIRHRLVTRAAKPLKGFERACEDLVGSGRAKTMDEARKKLAPVWGVDLKRSR